MRSSQLLINEGHLPVCQRGSATPYRLACADFTFPLLPHARVPKLIAMLEFEGVDIGLFEGRSHLRPSQEFQAPERSGAALKRQLDGEGLVATDTFLQMDPDFAPYAINQPDDTRRALARDWFTRLLDYAAAAGARHVTTLPGVGEAAETLGAMAHNGFFKQMTNHSTTSQYGTLSRGPALINDAMRAQAHKNLYDDVKGGAFVQEWSREQATGGAKLQELTQHALQHPMSLAEDNVIAAMQAVHKTAEGGKQ